MDLTLDQFIHYYHHTYIFNSFRLYISSQSNDNATINDENCILLSIISFVLIHSGNCQELVSHHSITAFSITWEKKFNSNFHPSNMSSLFNRSLQRLNMPPKKLSSTPTQSKKKGRRSQFNLSASTEVEDGLSSRNRL